MKIIVQPASPNNNKIVHSNIENTLKKSVSLEKILSHLRTDQRDAVKLSFEEHQLKDAWVWGVLPKHRKKWSLFSPEDKVIFGGYNEVSFLGTILCTVESSTLAQNIWTSDPNEGPFSCIYILKDLIEINANKDEFSNTRKEVHPKGTGITWQGLMDIKDAESVDALYSLIADYTGESSRSVLVQPFSDTKTPGRSESSLLEEGAEVIAIGKRRKRSKALLEAARTYFRGKQPDNQLRCLACQYSAPETLSAKREIVQIHHQEMISNSDSDGHTIDLNSFDYESKLLPLCPTCHVIAHTSLPPLNLKEIKEILGTN